MLDNLRQVLLQRKKLLALFVLVVFLPSFILAYFGIRAIRNERYKLQQMALEQQKGFARVVRSEVQTLLDKEASAVRELSASRSLAQGDDRSFSEAVRGKARDRAVRGWITVWIKEGSVWFPGVTPHPPAAGPAPVAGEWKRFQPDIALAEDAEFRRKDLSLAVSRYERLLRRAEDENVRAWLQGRIARCVAKLKDFPRAADAYRALFERFQGAVTESGRSLELASRMEWLEALRAGGDVGAFNRGAVQSLERLDELYWSLDGDQAGLYASRLKEMIDEVLEADPPGRTSQDVLSRIEGLWRSVERKSELGRMAEAARKGLLPAAGEGTVQQAGDGSDVQRHVLEFEGQDILVFLSSLETKGFGTAGEFLGSLVRIEDLRRPLDGILAQGSPSGLSVLLRSTLSDRAVYGPRLPAGSVPVLTDLFPGSFPPWRIEVHLDEGGGTAAPLYENIFFWTILALLVIVVFGSGLMIRMVAQEVSLLNLKSEFIASVSHEFKTPLTAMGAVLERLLERKVDDPQQAREYYRILRHDSERLKRLVKNILDFTKIEDGKREYKRTTVDIARLAHQEVDDFRRENGPSGFSVALKVEGNIPPLVADEEALRQALHNILDNAAKFSGQRKDIEVTVLGRQDDVEVAVKDHGVGIPENEQKKVFEKFFRGRSASSVSPTGTGLGLTLVKHIMDAHGGKVVIRSRPGEGSRVSLVFPLGKEDG